MVSLDKNRKVLTLKYNPQTSSAFYGISDESGALLKKGEFQPEITEVPLTGFNSGQYSVRIVDGEKHTEHKFIL